MRSSFAALLALAAPLYAISITSPSKNDVVDLAAGVAVKWTTVSTDPSTAHLYLVNMASGNTPYRKDLGEIDLSSGSKTVTASDVPDDEGYQFNFESTSSQNTGILAQSEQFEVKAAGDDSSSSPSSSASSSAAGATTTVTESKTASETVFAASSTTGPSVTVTNTASTAPTTLLVIPATATASGTARAAATSSTSTGAAPTGMAVQGGSLIALVAGVAAVLA